MSSAVLRLRATAEIVLEVSGLAVELQLDDRLKEVSLGSWDGLTDEDIEHVSPGACDGSTHFDWFFRSPDGESFDEAQARLSQWLAEVDAGDECHIAVSHGLSGRILRGSYLGLSKRDTLRLDVPQDGMFVLENGRCDFVSARP